jgi:UDP-N-acetylmuramoylalanine--D-glutamate ligase
MMNEQLWKDQRVVILGAARQGTALARYLVRHGAKVMLSDLRSTEELSDARAALADLAERDPHSLEWYCGGHPLELLNRADLVCVSGGVPLEQPIIVEAQRRGIRLSNDSQIFLEIAPCKVIGITGSAGKTTTTSLVGRMAQVAYRQMGISAGGQVWVGGNIGSPLITEIEQMKPEDLAVVEMSSFQLEIMERSPQVAAVLNITPNHLDRHGTMQAYRKAKARILEYQTGENTAVLCPEDLGSWSLSEMVRGKLVTFGFGVSAEWVGTYLQRDDLVLWDGKVETPILPREAVRLRGEHNLLNTLAACAIAHAAGLPVESMRAGIDGFVGVPHRLEFVRSWGGAEWYNDSIATAPERSMAAIRSFEEPLVLLAGGRDKDLPWEEFASLVRQRVKHLIVFGEAAGKIERAVGESYPKIRCHTLAEAVQTAAGVVELGDVVLLSPGGTSFDEFRDFEERGECFRRLVMQL